MWVRGLKPLHRPKIKILSNVAPRVGAWIETFSETLSKKVPESHPVWVRGLKHEFDQFIDFFEFVAPRVGAWIETISIPSLTRAR